MKNSEKIIYEMEIERLKQQVQNLQDENKKLIEQNTNLIQKKPPKQRYYHEE